MNLGVQYYRPPFPVTKHWEKDFDLIQDAGLDTVQLWLVWAWIESKPGRFDFGDYDRLVELADQRGLKVVLSTIAEIHPYWLHREIPDSEMVNHLGQKVISSNRTEIHFGLTPGGCFDHPGVWDRMQRFLVESTTHFRSAPNLAGWDCWNELRWNVHADGFVCFCPHTLQRFRAWLDRSYGGLDALNRQWKRRYNSFDEILPGKWLNRPYTEMMAWERFIAWRSNEHGRMRYETMKPLDPAHDVTAHAASPTALSGGNPPTDGTEGNYPGNRGNDWDLATSLDGVGCSSFPKWSGIDEAAFGMRIDVIKSAAQGKKVWLSEIQGGRAATGFHIFDSVDAQSQQRWIWTGIACGADKLLFWCWRDEVFGSESAGFGIIGNDGLAEERVAALRKTRAFLTREQALLDQYKPDLDAEVAVLFSLDSQHLAFAQDGKASRITNGFSGYLRALTRLSIPYRVADAWHLETGLAGVKILFLPRVIVLAPQTEEILRKFVEAGGTLVCESECGAFNLEGLYQYPEERFLAGLTGVREMGRRKLETQSVAVAVGSLRVKLGMDQWATPLTGGNGRALAKGCGGDLVTEVACGQGKVVLLGSYFGDPYLARWNRGFESFLAALCDGAGVRRDVEVISPAVTKDSFVYVKTGTSAGRKVVFLFFPAGVKKATLRVSGAYLKSARLQELFTGQNVEFKKTKAGLCATVAPGDLGLAVLREEVPGDRPAATKPRGRRA